MTAHLNRPPLSTPDALSPLEAQSGGSLPRKGFGKSRSGNGTANRNPEELYIIFVDPFENPFFFQSKGYV